MAFNKNKWKYLKYELELRWQRMTFKEWINRNPKVFTSIAAVSFLLFAVIAIAQLIPDKPPAHEEPNTAWFCDLNTNQLFEAKSSKLPPIKAPSGTLPDGSPAGVRAYLFDSDQPNSTQQSVGLLEKLSPEGKQAQKNYDPKNHDSKLWATGRFFRRPDQKEWTPANTPKGIALYQQFHKKNNNLSVKTKIR